MIPRLWWSVFALVFAPTALVGCSKPELSKAQAKKRIEQVLLKMPIEATLLLGERHLMAVPLHDVKGKDCVAALDVDRYRITYTPLGKTLVKHVFKPPDGVASWDAQYRARASFVYANDVWDIDPQRSSMEFRQATLMKPPS